MGAIYLKVLLIMAVFVAFALPGFALKKFKMIGEGGYAYPFEPFALCLPACVGD